MSIEQGYPGGPRPPGAHRAVSCHCRLGTVARRTLIADVNAKLLPCFERMSDGRLVLEHVFERRPDLRERFRVALRP